MTTWNPGMGFNPDAPETEDEAADNAREWTYAEINAKAAAPIQKPVRVWLPQYGRWVNRYPTTRQRSRA